MELTVNGRKVFCYTGGRSFDASLPVVVMLHGAEHDHSVWALQSRYLAHHGHAMLVPDLPGHGRSDGPALASVEAIADWVVALLDASQAAGAALVGHSMGSLASLDCAARHPGRITRVALIGTAFPMKVSPELLEATLADESRAQQMVSLWCHSAWAHYPGCPGPGSWLLGGDLRLMQRQKPGVMHTDFAACNAYAAGFERASQLRCPALFILGRRDVMTPARSGRELAKKVSGAQVIEIPDCGHALMNEKPDEVLDALAAFLAPGTTAANAVSP